jgi:hypothetical protein
MRLLQTRRLPHGPRLEPTAGNRKLQADHRRPYDQPLLSKLEQFPAPGIRGPQAAQLIGFATVYGTTPLRLVAPDALDQLDPHERNTLIRCNAAFTPAPPPQPGEAIAGRLDSLERSEIPDTRGARRVRLADSTLELERQVVTAARKPSGLPPPQKAATSTPRHESSFATRSAGLRGSIRSSRCPRSSATSSTPKTWRSGCWKPPTTQPDARALPPCRGRLRPDGEREF